MKVRTAERVALEALALADALRARLPADAEIPVGDIFALAWPLARRLVRLERRAARDAAARREREALQAQISAVLAVESETPAPGYVLGQSVPFDPAGWRVALLPEYRAADHQAA